MGSRAVDLVVNITTKAKTAAVEQAGAVYSKMASNVDRAGSVAERTSRRLNITAESADGLGEKAGKATGALGALSSGFELVGLEKYAGGLQAAALATDFFSGIGDGLNLILESTAVASARAKVATIAQGVASKTTAAAQWALNAAMAANPIAIVVIAVLALVAAFVIAYKKSERFRHIVQTVMKAVRNAIGWVIDKIGDLIGWVKDKAPAALEFLKRVAVGYFKLITLPVRTLIKVISLLVGWVKDKAPAAWRVLKSVAVTAWHVLTAPARTLIHVVGNIVNRLRGPLGGAFRWLKGVATGAINAILWPIRKLLDLANRVKDALSSIHVPSFGLFGGGIFGAAAAPARLAARTAAARPTLAAGLYGAQPLTATAGSSSSGGDSPTVQIIIQGAIDKFGTARQIREILGADDRRFGRR